MADRRCQFWLPNKRRFCANSPLPNSSFCGNHSSSRGEERVPCPIDPSHSVSKGSIDAHVKRCPFRKQAQQLEAQPFYLKGINSGDGDEPGCVTAEEKREAIFKLSVPEFHELVCKIKSIHSSLSSAAGMQDSYIVPEACSIWLKQLQESRQLPYQEKHALQQASIIGNMERFGLLKSATAMQAAAQSDQAETDAFISNQVGTPAVVEFGAGRGYLTHMLADCYGINKVFLVERRSYKLKADRSLRQSENMSLTRMRIDIEDFNISAVGALRGLPYLATGKHICGPASDMTLRCCGHKNDKLDKNALSTGSCHLQGLALATCCHHLCQWQHYINTRLLIDLGVTKEDFHAITWFSSWAVDAVHDSHLADMNYQDDQRFDIDTGEMKTESKDVKSAIRNMNPTERAVFGFMCKEIIDFGRLLWLKERNLDAHLVKYVPANISPENHLLVAKSYDIF